jgi:two-component system nitrogen regulation response regulator NtrX
VERIAILHAGATVTAAHVAALLPVLSGRFAPPAAAVSNGDTPLSDALDAYEREMIERALAGAAGNVADAARRLQTDRPNLYRRMRRLGIDSP